MSKVALITGTSKGIGLSLTKILLKNNFAVYGVRFSYADEQKKHET